MAEADVAPSEARIKRELAVSLAKRGFHVFPLEQNGRVPVIRDWPRAASSDPQTVSRLFSDALGEPVEYNIAIRTGQGLAVIDFDCKNGKTGLDALAAWDAIGAIPESLRARTASGGVHVFVTVPEGQDPPNSVGKLADGVDVRGHHGYVIAPGSTLDGRSYEWLSDSSAVIKPIDPDMLERCGKATIREDDEPRPALVELDTEASISRAIDWLQHEAPEAVEGSGGDFETYKVACKVRDFGVSPDTAFSLISEHWNETGKAAPPWPPEELQRKIANAYRYGQEMAGRNSALADFVRVPEVKPDHSWLAPRGLPFNLDAASLPPRRWVVDGLLARRFVTEVVAPSGAGKTQFLMQLGTAIAAGRNDVLGIDIVERTGVWYWNQEDDTDELSRRLYAGMKQRKVDRNELGDRFHINSGVDRPLTLAKRTGTGIARTEEVASIIGLLKAHGAGVLIVDPLIEFHEANENDNVEMRAAAAVLRYIAVQADCAVLFAHHTKKPDSASSDGFAGNADSGRGASSVQGVTRIVASLYAMSAKEAAHYPEVGEAHRHEYVRLDGAKSNLSLAGGGAQPSWFRRVSVTIENGEKVGALEPVILEKKKSVKTDWFATIAEAMVDAGMSDGTPHTVDDIWRLGALSSRAPNANNQWLKNEVPEEGTKREIAVSNGTLLLYRTAGTAKNLITFTPLRTS